ncbi:MAG TPA: hypothetical protein VMB35_00130 [Methanomicrobiales archaeon]|nr:hypothetical protein [Methanomicrobiales archaeon]
MTKDSGQLPVDFLVGFTIFILSLIMVANFVPSLLVGLQRTSGIDYDAVAYRTGVVLVEDPGEPSGLFPIGSPPPPVPPSHPQWDLQAYYEKEFVNRFGLTLSHDTPNILSINKIERFFNTSFFNDTDYRNKLLFSSYQYGYNVSLQNISPMKAADYPNGILRTIGQPYPEGYGYIRRYVVIKQNSESSLNLSTFWIPDAFIASREDQVDRHTTEFGDLGSEAHQVLRIRFDNGILYSKALDPSLMIDLQREPISIRITNFSSTLNNTAFNTWGLGSIANSSEQWAQNNEADVGAAEKIAPINATLIAVHFGDPTATDGDTYWTNFVRGVNLTVDGNHVDWASTSPSFAPVTVNNTIELYVPPLEPTFFNDGRPMDVSFVFQDRLPHTLVSGTLWYDYNSRNVTQPVLSTGMMEVAIW